MTFLLSNCNNSSFRNKFIFSTVSGIYTLCLRNQPVAFTEELVVIQSGPDLSALLKTVCIQYKEHMSLVLLQESLKAEGRQSHMIHPALTPDSYICHFIITIGGLAGHERPEGLFCPSWHSRSLVYAMAPVSGILSLTVHSSSIFMRR